MTLLLEMKWTWSSRVAAADVHDRGVLERDTDSARLICAQGSFGSSAVNIKGAKDHLPLAAFHCMRCLL